MFGDSFGVDGLWRIEKLLDFLWIVSPCDGLCLWTKKKKHGFVELGFVWREKKKFGGKYLKKKKINACGVSSWMMTCIWTMSPALVGSWLGPYLHDFSKWVIQLGELSKCRGDFYKGLSISVWKDIYFPQNPLTFKSKK